MEVLLSRWKDGIGISSLDERISYIGPLDEVKANGPNHAIH
jgi:hypothetical protein